jgi:hypothetical protein
MKIIQDTREKYPWNFSLYNIECIKRKLDTGDYSIEGYEDQICLERKRTTSEIAINLGKKCKPFEAELQRMATFRFAFILCEFELEDITRFPVGSGIPQNQWPYIKMTPQFIHSRLNKWSETYGVEIIYCGDTSNAECTAISLLRESFNVLNSENRIK